MEEANKLIGTGKKHLVMGKAVEAVGALQEACGMLAKKYGDTADECGEALFWCGKALLDLARMENTVLGNALEGVPEEEEEEEKPKDSNVEGTDSVDEKTRDELRVQVYDAMAEKKEEEDKQKEEAEKKKSGDEAEAEDKKEAKKEEKKEKEEEKSEVNEGKSAEKEEQKEGEEEQAEDGEEEEGEEEEGGDDAEMEAEDKGEGDAEKDSDEEEEVGNLQLAWEMLEVAKVIYKRKESKDDQLMAAQAHLKLGEVSAESGNYTQALEDFQECLKLQVKHLDSDSRLLAETHYQLGLAHGLNLQYRQAVDELGRSIAVIKSRLDKLQKLLDAAEGPEALPDERKEMEELKALLPEIQEKVEDATEGLKTANAEAVKDVMGGGSTSSAFPEATLQKGNAPSSSKVNGASNSGVASNGHSTSAPVSDISHLVRKKRKPEESPVKDGAVKKVKQGDAHTNGVADGKTNGHTNGMEVESK